MFWNSKRTPRGAPPDKDKLRLLHDAGAHPCKTFMDIPKTLKKLGV